MRRTQSYTKTKRNESKTNDRTEPVKDKNKENVNDFSPAITVKPISNDHISNSESAKRDSLPRISQSIENLYEANSEMRKIAEIISKVISIRNSVFLADAIDYLLVIALTM